MESCWKSMDNEGPCAESRTELVRGMGTRNLHRY